MSSPVAVVERVEERFVVETLVVRAVAGTAVVMKRVEEWWVVAFEMPASVVAAVAVVAVVAVRKYIACAVVAGDKHEGK